MNIVRRSEVYRQRTSISHSFLTIGLQRAPFFRAEAEQLEAPFYHIELENRVLSLTYLLSLASTSLLGLVSPLLHIFLLDF